jgi:hypothetical protein
MHSSSLHQPAYEVIIADEIAEVRQENTTGAKSLHAKQSFLPGAILCKFNAEAILSTATYLTVQLDDDEHISLLPEFLRYTNHSCAPNIFFDTTRLEVACIKEISPGDELAFFYPSSEWDMAQPFKCCCGTDQCIGTIQGAAHLAGTILNKYRLTDYIQRKLKARL